MNTVDLNKKAKELCDVGACISMAEARRAVLCGAFDKCMEKNKRKEKQKCIVKGCTNLRSQGRFIGDLCYPCYEFITTGKGTCSQAYRNAKMMNATEDIFIVKVPSTKYIGIILSSLMEKRERIKIDILEAKRQKHQLSIDYWEEKLGRINEIINQMIVK